MSCALVSCALVSCARPRLVLDHLTEKVIIPYETLASVLKYIIWPKGLSLIGILSATSSSFKTDLEGGIARQRDLNLEWHQPEQPAHPAINVATVVPPLPFAIHG